MATYKCPICGKKDQPDKMVKIGDRYYHLGECENKKIETDNQKGLDKEDWDKLFKYICELYNIDCPTGFMFKQLKTYREDYQYTNNGIYLTLKYYYETLENEVLEDTGLGIVPYYYEQAKKHNTDIWDIEDSLDDFNECEQTHIINIKPPNKQYTPSKKQYLNLKEIDWGEDE